MVAAPRGAGETLDDRFEDFGLGRGPGSAEPKRESARKRPVVRSSNVGAGTGPPLDQPFLLQIPQRPPDGDPRRAERLDQVGFARQALPGFETTRP